jgi:hypothetical protein
VHIAPACTGPEKGPTTLVLIYAVISYISVGGCFQDLIHDLMVTRQLHPRAKAPLHFIGSWLKKIEASINIAKYV